MDWKEKAIRTLRDRFYPVPGELNELDRKKWVIYPFMVEYYLQSKSVTIVIC